ncbi:MAG: VanZ family protein [Bacteroidetes bacterium]|nr:MAG: VanZ family protein [Bacteroidota bacterium]
MLKLNKTAAYALAVCCLLATTYLLTLPGNSLPQSTWFDAVGFDKWVHVGLFGGLTGSWFLPFRAGWNTRFFRTVAIVVAALVLAYGVGMEFVQKWYVPNRNFDVWDIVADGVGCALAYVLLARAIKIQAPLTP